MVVFYVGQWPVLVTYLTVFGCFDPGVMMEYQPTKAPIYVSVLTNNDFLIVDLISSAKHYF